MRAVQVVIVEDDIKIADIQKHFIEKIDGFEVTGIAYSISEAEEILGILKPNLVLLDIYFPDGNGIDLLWKIRSQYRETDVILITAAKEAETLQEAIRGGVFDYILKPVVFNRFRSTLKEYRTHLKNLSDMEEINQDDVDRLLHPKPIAHDETQENPKGIDSITLRKIENVMSRSESHGYTADQVGEIIGTSRTTARRYLEYLVSRGVISTDLSYGTVGRPGRVYHGNR